jgi:hypothetical protein
MPSGGLIKADWLKRSSRRATRLLSPSRYPVDLAHNFVLADSRCNIKKRDRLQAWEHLAAWSERNAKYGGQ